MRKTLLLIVTFCLLILTVGCGTDDNSKEIMDSWAKQKVTNETVKQVIEANTLINKIVILEIKDDGTGGKNVVIGYDIGTQLDEKSTVKNIAYDSVEVFKILFKNPNISKVLVDGTTTFIDQYGKESQGHAAWFMLNKEAANKIQWDNFRDLVLRDYNNLINVSEKYYINPAISSKL